MNMNYIPLLLFNLRQNRISLENPQALRRIARNDVIANDRNADLHPQSSQRLGRLDRKDGDSRCPLQIRNYKQHSHLNFCIHLAYSDGVIPAVLRKRDLTKG